MRVGLLTYGSVETLTGGYVYERRLLEYLESKGDRVEVVSFPAGNYIRHLVDNLSPSRVRLLGGQRFDVLLQDELSHPSLFLLNRRIRAEYPIVAVVHVLRSSEHMRSRLRLVYAGVERRYLATIDAAVFNSEATRAAVEDLLGHGVPGVVAYPGGDHLPGRVTDDEVAARARARGPLRILSVANVVPGKGLHHLVSALARIPVDGWRLSVAGSLTMDRDYAQDLARNVRRLGVAANVELLGVVPNAAIGNLLASAQVLAVPSAYEALGIAYLEAMRFGLPVIATSAGGAPEIIDDGREGFLVAPGDVDTLTRSLRLLIDDREVVLRMGRAGRRRAERHPTWDQSFALARELLCSVAGAARPREQQRTLR